jgi:hypothetical protein
MLPIADDKYFKSQALLLLPDKATELLIDECSGSQT